jgi:hypothetical protein
MASMKYQDRWVGEVETCVPRIATPNAFGIAGTAVS